MCFFSSLWVVDKEVNREMVIVSGKGLSFGFYLENLKFL